MDNEKIIKLQHFFSVDTKIKKEIYDIAPQSLNGYIDETSISEYMVISMKHQLVNTQIN